MVTWKPTFIAPDGVDRIDRVVRMRRRFELNREHGAVVEARLRFSAHGIVEARINGTPATESLLTPGHSSYEWRLRYAEAEVSRSLRPTNDLELWLGPGWYAGRLGWENNRALYGGSPSAAAELRLEYADGSIEVITSDDTWTWAPSPVVTADLYDGQTTDARIGAPPHWQAVRSAAAPDAPLVPYIAPPVVRQQTVQAIKVWRSPAGHLLVDFGQNLVGWTRLRVSGPAGTVVAIRHAEVLEQDELGTRPLRSAAATDRHVLSGGQDDFEPTFTFHGFRYVSVDGWPGTDEDLSTALEAIVIGSDLRRTGHFRTSDARLNRFHENVVWGMRGNFVDVPTDCPQRDERLGWTGDIALFAPTASFLFDVGDFLTDWMEDLRVETAHAGGVVPYVVPDVLKLEPKAPGNTVFGSSEPTAVWGDAAVWVPWALFQADGDLERLERLFPTMALHADRVTSVLTEDGAWTTGFQFGDWLDPTAPPEDPAAGATPPELVATASGYRTFRLMADAAATLGRTGEASRYRATAARMRAAFRSRWVRGGELSVESVTAYALAIEFGLLEPDEIPVSGERLAELVRANGHRIATGFAGTPYVTDALTTAGYVDDAYRLLLQTECPSWLYSVTMGATTVWERWDSMLPDGTINPGQMTSFNHYALGSVADWLHRTVGGIAPEEPGYARVRIAPRPGPGIHWAETSLDVDAGTIRVRWSVSDDTLVIDVDSPVDGVLSIPGSPDQQFEAGTATYRERWDPERHRVAVAAATT